METNVIKTCQGDPVGCYIGSSSEGVWKSDIRSIVTMNL